MAKKRKIPTTKVKKKIKKRIKTITADAGKLTEAQGDIQTVAGRFANHIQLILQEEEIILDFFARSGQQVTHQARIFVTPKHAERLSILLRRQVRLHRARFKSP
jgi:hypothetical protein